MRSVERLQWRQTCPRWSARRVTPLSIWSCKKHLATVAHGIPSHDAADALTVRPIDTSQTAGPSWKGRQPDRIPWKANDRGPTNEKRDYFSDPFDPESGGSSDVHTAGASLSLEPGHIIDMRRRVTIPA